MRVVLTQHAATAHLFLMVPIAWALKAAGHEVVIAGQPDIIDPILHTGLTAVEVGKMSDMGALLESLPADKKIYGSGYDIAELRPEKLNYSYVRDCLAAFASPLALDLITDEPMYDELVDFAREWKPDLVIWDSITFPGPVAAAAVGAAQVRSLLGRDHWARMYSLFLKLRAEQPGEVTENPVRDWLTAKLDRFDLPFHDDLILGQATIDPMPSWMRFPIDHEHLAHEYKTVRFIPYNGPSLIPDWLKQPAPERPRVCFSLGVSGREVWGGRGSVRAQDLFDAVADLDIEVVATLKANQFDAGSKIPDNVRLVEHVPLNALLPSCSAIIHHGGTGTTETAVIHGVPHLVVPAALYDEAPAARAIAARGASIVLEQEDFSVTTLRRDLLRLLNEPSFKQSATRLQQEMAAAPTPHDLVADLVDLTERHHAGR